MYRNRPSWDDIRTNHSDSDQTTVNIIHNITVIVCYLYGCICVNVYRSMISMDKGVILFFMQICMNVYVYQYYVILYFLCEYVYCERMYVTLCYTSLKYIQYVRVCGYVCMCKCHSIIQIVTIYHINNIKYVPWTLHIIFLVILLNLYFLCVLYFVVQSEKFFCIHVSTIIFIYEDNIYIAQYPLLICKISILLIFSDLRLKV